MISAGQVTTVMESGTGIIQGTATLMDTVTIIQVMQPHHVGEERMVMTTILSSRKKKP